MPLVSKAQRRYFHWAEAAGKLAPGTAAKWEAHTPKGKKLPERVHPKDDAAEKKAFVAHFLLKCAAAGVTDPEGVAWAAEALLAGVEKRAVDPLGAAGSLLGGAAGLAVIPPVLGMAAFPAAGYLAGGALASARNQMDEDDAKTMRLAATANAYRRRAANR